MSEPVMRVALEVTLRADAAFLDALTVLAKMVFAAVGQMKPRDEDVSPLAAACDGPAEGDPPPVTIPAEKMPDPPSPNQSAKGVWTPARLALLRERWAAGDGLQVVFAKINALPGPNVASHAGIKSKLKHLGIRRNQPEAQPAQVVVPLEKWTEARVALLRRRWPEGMAAEALLAALNDLPGAPLPNTKALENKAYALTIRRGHALPTPAQPKIRKLVRKVDYKLSDALLAADATPEAVRVKWKDALAWGAHQNIDITADEDAVLDSINALRRSHDLPPFEIDETVRDLGKMPAPSFGASPGKDSYKKPRTA